MPTLKERLEQVMEDSDVDVRHIEVDENQQLVTIYLDRDSQDKIKPGQVESVIDLVKSEFGMGLDANWLSPNEGTIMFGNLSYYVSVT